MSARRAFGAPVYRTRLVLGFLLVVALIGGAWAWSLYPPLRASVTAQQKQRLEDLARASAVAVSASDAQLEQTVDALGSSARITVVATDGTVLADSEEDPGKLENHGNRPEVRAALSGTTGTDTRTSGTQGIKRMYVAVPGTYRGEPVAVRASEPLAMIDGMVAGARGSGLALLATFLVLAVATSWLITRSAAKPVERLARAARAMADGDLAASIPEGDSGLSPLAGALADLREQLRERITALDAERHTLRVALDGLSDGVLLLDDHTVRLANREFSAMFRTPPGELRGRELGDLGLPESILATIETHLASGKAVATDLGPDPFHRYHRVLVMPLGELTEGERTLVVTSDQTDRMRLDAVRRDFVANASHELKTPTAAIVLLAESAGHAADDGDDAQALAFVSQISEEALRLKNLVADLLDLSRLESTPGANEIADVRRAVELALAGHRRAATAKGLELEADLNAVSGSDVAVRCGATDFAIVLDNLLSNAIAYTEEGRVTVGVSADDSVVTVDVTDTGIGIPAGELERVFERFYRVDRARSRTSGGTGLGLSLVRNITERTGGIVTISSKPGSGTTATVRLPRAL